MARMITASKRIRISSTRSKSLTRGRRTCYQTFVHSADTEQLGELPMEETP